MSKAKSAELIMKLYDLRREEKMRHARDWFAGYFPESAEEIMQTVVDPETSANYRMVVSYWDMAATFVNQGAIDAEMFLAVSGECIIVFAKVFKHLDALREMTQSPQMLANLEQLIMSQPNAEETLNGRLEMMKKYRDLRAEAAKSA